MCNAFVDLALRLDQHQTLLFAPLQGKTAQKLLPPLPQNAQKWSIMYIDRHGITYDQSDAVLAICRQLGGGWQLLSLLRYVPRFIRNPIYRQVAQNRYSVLGKRETCRIPNEAEKSRFLP